MCGENYRVKQFVEREVLRDHGEEVWVDSNDCLSLSSAIARPHRLHNPGIEGDALAPAFDVPADFGDIRCEPTRKIIDELARTDVTTLPSVEEPWFASS